ncbi:MAG: hypothetical protein JXB03_06975 [Spirochaetales bacterium]|nr:hypothetical protein [Spirochaetales bacterium]
MKKNLWLLGFVFFFAGMTVLWSEEINLYYFKQTGCLNCAQMDKFLETLTKDFPELTVTRYNISDDRETARLYENVTDALSIRSPAVPLVLVGDYYYMGARAQILEEISFIVSSYRVKPYEDRMGRLLSGEIDDVSTVSAPREDLIRLPLIGDIRLGELSLAGSTALIAFVDGFNPCSLWVLSLVLGMSLHGGRRMRVLLIGSIFLVMTSLVYGGFLFGAVKVVSILRFSGLFKVLLIVFIAFFAAVNIKDYFFWKQGMSFTIGQKGQSAFIGLLKRNLNPSRGLIPLAAGSAVLAVSAALIELPCTAGFPVLWAQVLSGHNISAAVFWVYLAEYLAVYLLDEIIVLAAAVITLRRQFMDESKGRVLKLASGALMLMIALHVAWFQDFLRTGWGLLSVAVSTIAAAFLLSLVRRLTVKSAAQ